jgi:hypothetical protein
MNEPTVNLVEFTGLRNRQDDRRLPPGGLVAANNIDLDDTHGLIIRPGFQHVLALDAVTASYATTDGSRLYIVDGGVLKRSEDGLDFVEIAVGLPGDYLYWLEVADSVYVSSGHVIDRYGKVSLWRIPPPALPVVNVVSGDLPAGRYRVVLTQRNHSGVEGGATSPIIVDVEDHSGLQVAPADDPLFLTVLYMTDTNGTVYYRVSDNTNGVIVITSTMSLSTPLEVIQLTATQAPQAASILALHENKLVVCQTLEERSYLWFSQPFWYNLFDLHNDYIAVQGRVNALVQTRQGLLIGTDTCLYVYTSEQTLTLLAEYGVPRGIPYSVSDQDSVYLWTHQGVVMFPPFQNLTEEKVSLSPGAVVHTELVEQNGFRKLLMLVDGAGLNDNPGIRQALALRGQINNP